MDTAHIITHIATLGLPASVLSVVATYAGRATLAALSPGALRERTIRAAVTTLLNAEDEGAADRATAALRLLTAPTSDGPPLVAPTAS